MCLCQTCPGYWGRWRKEGQVDPREPKVDPRQQAWRDFFQSQAWEELNRELEEQRDAALEGTVNAQSWDEHRHHRGALVTCEAVVDFFAERLDEATRKE